MTTDIRKPAGIIALIIYSTFSGLMLILVGLVMLFISFIPDISVWISIYSILLIVFGVLLLVSIYGLWNIESWGWKLTFWLYITSVPISIIFIFPILPDSTMSLANTIFQIGIIAIDVTAIFYLKKDETEKLYGVF